VGDRLSKRSLSGPLRIDVNPLAILGAFREGVDARLLDAHGKARAEPLPWELGQAGDTVDDQGLVRCGGGDGHVASKLGLEPGPGKHVPYRHPTNGRVLPERRLGSATNSWPDSTRDATVGGLVAAHVMYDSLRDGELWSQIHPPASRRLLMAALDCFATRGYHGTTTRQIAMQAGMSPGAVYVHFRSKGELLYTISIVGHLSALAALEDALVDDGAGPAARIDRAVRSFAAWHARHHRLARVQYELESLPLERRREIVKLRARFGTIVERELGAGVASGAFGPIDIEGAALAILSLCIDIARWYGPKSHRTPDGLGALYADLVARALRAKPPLSRP
jgi:AcrR family transcriptional regulator